VRVVRVLRVIVIRGMGNLRLRIAVVPLAEFATTVVIVRTFRLRGALFPVDLLPRALVPREVGAAATAARLSALILPSFRWITVLAGITGPHVLSWICRLVLEVVLDIGTRLGPVFRGPGLADTAVLADMTIPDDRAQLFGVYVAAHRPEVTRIELDELLHIAGLVQLGLPARGHRAEVVGQRSDLRGSYHEVSNDGRSIRMFEEGGLQREVPPHSSMPEEGPAGQWRPAPGANAATNGEKLDSSTRSAFMSVAATTIILGRPPY
jgi:hypothetical protein